MRPGTYVLLITSPINAALNYLFCYPFQIGLLGAPLATSLSYWLSFFLLVLYTRFIAGSRCWGGWSHEATENLNTFFRLAILGIIHVGSEWWAFEIVALAAGQLGTISLAAQSVITTADQIFNTSTIWSQYSHLHTGGQSPWPPQSVQGKECREYCCMAQHTTWGHDLGCADGHPGPLCKIIQ